MFQPKPCRKESTCSHAYTCVECDRFGKFPGRTRAFSRAMAAPLTLLVVLLCFWSSARSQFASGPLQYRATGSAAVAVNGSAWLFVGGFSNCTAPTYMNMRTTTTFNGTTGDIISASLPSQIGRAYLAAAFTYPYAVFAGGKCVSAVCF